MKAAREVFFEKFADVKADQLVFLDEFGASTTMQRTHGRAAPGERVVTKLPHGHWKIISSIAAMTTRGIVASASFDGATDTETFLTFVREELAPMLVPGQVLVMDNLSAHRSPLIDAFLLSMGVQVIRLPPFSPDFNPIEMAISKIKTGLRSLGRRSISGLLNAIGEVLRTISPTDALNYMAHCGYATQ